jgi:stage II sporulation protein AA (anti-sigma F factor antagonist)
VNKKRENGIIPKKKDPQLTLDVIGRCLVVGLQEELDHHYAIRLREKTDRLLDKGKIKHIIFDFTGVKFMDSSGIGVIMGRYKRVIFTGGKVAVVGVGGSIDRILNLSGLYKIIEKYETVKDAVGAL